MNQQGSDRSAKTAGLASALGLLAATAPAEIIRYLPDPVVDTGFNTVPLISWDPIGTDAIANDAYPGTYAAAMYGCFGYLELSVGAPEGLDFYYDTSAGYAPMLGLGTTIGPAHTDWITDSAGWVASIDTSGYTWGSDFYIGYRVESGTDYLYGYARLSAEYNAGDSEERILLKEWVYENTPNTAVTVVPEPGIMALMLMGALGLAFKRFFKRCRG